MEMPEGYDRLLKTRFEQIYIEGEGQPYQFLHDCKYALDLMKEMAEALDRSNRMISAMIDDSKKQGQEVLPILLDTVSVLQKGVLKKFELWK